MTYEVIGLTGYAGSGKDTIAECMIDAGWYRVAYADKLKEMVWGIDPIVDSCADTGTLVHLQDYAEFIHCTEDLDIYGQVDLAKKYSEGCRSYLQRLGQSMRHIEGPDYWVRKLQEEMTRLLLDEGVLKFVITDIRYSNETAPCDWLVAIEREGVGPLNSHRSEQQITDLKLSADFTVMNNGTPQEAADYILARVQ
jgi:hypothetical protein